MNNFSFILNERQPWTKYVKFGKEYNNNVHLEGVNSHLRPASCHYSHWQNRASNESYARKMNIITIATHFC